MTIIRGLSIDAYHQAAPITNTKLKAFRQSPLLYHRIYNLGVVQLPDKDHFRIGRAADCLLFDGREVYSKQYAVAPSTYENEDGKPVKWNGNANYCKAWARMQVVYGRTVLSSADALIAENILQAVMHDPLASALLAQGEPQVTFRRASERFGLEMQVRPDWFSQDPIDNPDLGLTSHNRPYLCDLKTIARFDDIFDHNDPENPWSGRTIWSMGYHRQAGMAQWVAHKDIGETAHFLIFAEKCEPWRVAVVELDGEYLDTGWKDVERDLLRLKACMTANQWPGSPKRVITLRAPMRVLDADVRQTQAAVEQGLIGQGV